MRPSDEEEMEKIKRVAGLITKPVAHFGDIIRRYTINEAMTGIIKLLPDLGAYMFGGMLSLGNIQHAFCNRSKEEVYNYIIRSYILLYIEAKEGTISKEHEAKYRSFIRASIKTYGNIFDETTMKMLLETRVYYDFIEELYFMLRYELSPQVFSVLIDYMANNPENVFVEHMITILGKNERLTPDQYKKLLDTFGKKIADFMLRNPKVPEDIKSKAKLLLK
jgi:hypothetical protein